MIIQNALKCNNCGDFINSRHRHDYVVCSCGACVVDGGLDYIRRGGEDYEDFTLTLEHDIEEIRERMMILQEGEAACLKDYKPLDDIIDHYFKLNLSGPRLLALIKEKQYRNETHLFEEGE